MFDTSLRSTRRSNGYRPCLTDWDTILPWSKLPCSQQCAQTKDVNLSQKQRRTIQNPVSICSSYEQPFSHTDEISQPETCPQHPAYHTDKISHPETRPQ